MVALPAWVPDGAAVVAAGAEDTAGEDTAAEDAAAEDAADVPLGTVIGTPAAPQRAPLTPRASSLNIDVSTTHARTQNSPRED